MHGPGEHTLAGTAFPAQKKWNALVKYTARDTYILGHTLITEFQRTERSCTVDVSDAAVVDADSRSRFAGRKDFRLGFLDDGKEATPLCRFMYWNSV
jgi:hypothetical protein